MVVKMMRWRPWPPPVTKKYEVRMVVKRLERLDQVREGEEKVGGGKSTSTVEIKWKGPKVALRSLRRTVVKRNCTREVEEVDQGVVQWDEEFWSICTLSAYKENVFHPWEIAFTVFNGLKQGPKNRIPIVGMATLNLSEYVSAAEEKELELNIPITPSSSASSPLLCISLSFLELRTVQEILEPGPRIFPAPSPPQCGENFSSEKEDLSALKAGLRKVKIITEFVSTRKAKKACHEGESSGGRCSSSPWSEEGESNNYPFDSDSLDDFEGGETDEGKDAFSLRKSFSYGSLAYANHAGGESLYVNLRIDGEYEDWVYCSNRKSDVGCSSTHVEDSSTASVSSDAPSSLLQGSKRGGGLLSWRKRKLSFRSPKAKGEPLLKKDYGEEGGDDIDYDRRQLSSDETLSPVWHKMEEDSSANLSSVSEFGDDNFVVGNWEKREIISRDGHMKLETQVFFASIDQRSEQAAGESACTVLVAIIADWFQSNRTHMPIKSQLDSLIREGSSEWRKLCENETYREQFPDKHFDLETVLQAKIRPLSEVHERSFVGFFHPEEGMNEGRFNFLHDAMSFDSMWEEISRIGLECSDNDEPQVYIVSWNDHFFILKVDLEAYYIIDTLGERLYEGCNQAYILKFDHDTKISKISDTVSQSSNEKTGNDLQSIVEADRKEEQVEEVEAVVCRGKESCKEYIKNFLAAIPIRELQYDIKKGLMASTPLHHRLQIELRYTRLLPSLQVNDKEEEKETFKSFN